MTEKCQRFGFSKNFGKYAINKIRRSKSKEILFNNLIIFRFNYELYFAINKTQ